MRVKVYRNLRHGRAAPPLYSIVHNGKVIAREHQVLLTDAVFHVNEAGRQRVLATGQKNVHAYVVGTLRNGIGAFGIDEHDKRLGMTVRYNPYEGPNFMLTGVTPAQPVKAARGVLLNEDGIQACYVS